MNLSYFVQGEVVKYRKTRSGARNGWLFLPGDVVSSFRDENIRTVPPDFPCVVLSEAAPCEHDPNHIVQLLLVGGEVVQYIDNVRVSDSIWERC